VTDTTTDIVPSKQNEGLSVPAGPRNRWWAWAMAGIGLALLAVIGVASLLPSTLVSDKENRRTGELEPTPYALTPASADAVNDRIVFGDLPDGVERFETASDFHFVTVTSPSQSVLSWFAGRNDPAVDFLTEEDKFGVRTPSQRREFNLQLMRTAEQEAQYVALTTLGYDVEITPGEVIVRDVLCKTPGEAGECDEWFPSDEQIDPADRILEAEGVTLESVEDLSAILADREPGDTIDLRIDRPGEGEEDVTVELSASPEDPDRTIVGFIPFDTRAISLPFEVDRRHRRAVGGSRLHTGDDRRAVAWRSHGCARRGGDRHDLARRHGGRDRRPDAEGLRGASERDDGVPGAGLAGRTGRSRAVAAAGGRGAR